MPFVGPHFLQKNVKSKALLNPEWTVKGITDQDLLP
jgi:hypothetical protein